MINVCRENLMDGAIRAFARRSFNPEAKLSVIFMDDFMQAEGSVDKGGPTRGFFRLLMIALRDSTLFTGPQNSKNLSLDSHALRRGLYRTYGVMIAVALVHGGVLPSCFSERLYQNLCSTPTSPPTLEEVADQDLQLKLKKISEAVDITAARAAIEEAAESLSLLGSLRHITTMEGRDQLVQAATSFYVEGRTEEALQHATAVGPDFTYFLIKMLGLAEGLNTIGLLDLMKIHPSIFKDVFFIREAFKGYRLDLPVQSNAVPS
ncbi:G2/M phase-specific E3 ubiquitin-protein ligase-like isoform X1 [Perca flavescens]|uniref:G2/M phase-specific E3 ubiquitin-protein ligase-like isoform X1 n=1 Tax=Perca flavescens TaxID=8167 RepID=UPI00106E5C9C|nr:G2/M phase-specific E3 ubiquitin-protein ligase-like isoform X1 [Perca flavescens]XP_028424199.1 G2/M phase-specific E3 ubiquitin-protein ligase-like isoform X1 [Perca flavescens]